MLSLFLTVHFNLVTETSSREILQTYLDKAAPFLSNKDSEQTVVGII